MVFLDSPMANKITEVFQQHPELYDREMTELMRQGNSPFDFPGLEMVRTVDESKAINHIAGTTMIIAGSGMCTGGRIKHHLVANITRRDVSEFLNLAHTMRIKPTVQEYSLNDANKALLELKKGQIQGAKVISIGH